MKQGRLLFSLLASTLFPLLAQAYELPRVNLGHTSFLDGESLKDHQWQIAFYSIHHDGNSLQDHEGKKIIVLNQYGKLDTTQVIGKVRYQSNQPIFFGARWGFEAHMPWITADLKPQDSLPRENQWTSNNSGLGDLAFGPNLQFKDWVCKGQRRFSSRAGLLIRVPTGRYDERYKFNPGSHVASINPYIAGTFFMTERWAATLRLAYLWSEKNRHPVGPTFTGQSDSKAGNAMHLNFASSIALKKDWFYIGVNGYYLAQTENTKASAKEIQNTKEQVFGIGPGTMVHLHKNTRVFFNAYFEKSVENRAKGRRYVLRLVHNLPNGS